LRANDEDRAASGWREIDETARKDALGRAGNGRDRPVRESDPLLRAHRQTV